MKDSSSRKLHTFALSITCGLYNRRSSSNFFRRSSDSRMVSFLMSRNFCDHLCEDEGSASNADDAVSKSSASPPVSSRQEERVDLLDIVVTTSRVERFYRILQAVSYLIVSCSDAINIIFCK